MKETQLHDRSWDQQQQTGESTNSSFDDYDVFDSVDDRMEEERILFTIANFLTLLDDRRSTGGAFETNRNFDEPMDGTRIHPSDSTARRRSRRRRRVPPSPRKVATTPEREIPLSLEDTSDNPLLSSKMMGGMVSPDYPAPDLVEISPNPDANLRDAYPRQHGGNETEEFGPEREHHYRSRSWAKQKLAAAIFSHPQPIRNFCLEAYQAVRERSLKINATEEDSSTEDADGVSIRNKQLDERRAHAPTIPMDIFYVTIPISVTLDTWNTVQEITLDVSFATVNITVMALDASVHVVMNVWDGVTRFNPLTFVNRIITRPFNMMGMTTEVVVSGIQSVADGVGSASSIALNRLNRSPSSTGFAASQGNLSRLLSPAKTKKTVNQKLLRKLNDLNSAAPVVSYTELGDNDGGLSRHAKSRVQRMMHYDVSLRPFVATVKLEESFKKDSSRKEYFYDDAGADSESSSPLDGPFMCTPQSFPPTPASRAHVLKRGNRFADDVVFLARDQLRVHDGLESSNERTREMAQALTQGKRLAVFDADDASAGIDLSCGQHGKLHRYMRVTIHEMPKN